MEKLPQPAPPPPFSDFNQGLAYLAQGETNQAIASFHQAIAAHQNQVQAHHALGLVLAKMGKLDDAIVHLRAAHELAPQNEDIHAALIQFLSQQEQWTDVLDELQSQPATPDNLADQALTLNAMALFEDAEQASRAALALAPDHPQARNNLGLALDGQERLDEAESEFRQCLHQDQSLNNLGHVLKKQGRLTESIQCYHDLMARSGPTPQISFNLAHSLLLDGQLRQGLAAYEDRLNYDNPVFPRRVFSQPRWHGQDIKDQTLLIYAEQGFGDSIQFCRFIPHIAQRYRVIFEVPRILSKLMKTLDANITIIERGSPLPHFDWHCPLVSLGHELGVELDDLDGQAYLRPDPNLQRQWHDSLQNIPHRRLGLVWAGNTKHANDRNRSVPFDQLAPLWETPNIHWISLQRDAIWHGPGTDISPQLENFEQSAAALANLDGLVTVDTAMAHLAGALGIPCWVLLPYSPDWRWLLNRNDSPWYNSLQLIRQPQPKDWGSVIHHLVQDLS